jgi:hypothetical protein
MTAPAIPRLIAGIAVTTVLALGGGLLAAAPAEAARGYTPWPGHPGRHLVWHRIVRGDTATGLAVRYHAWTRELLAINHLRASSILRIGRVIRIPVVDAAVPRKPTKKPAKKHAANQHPKSHQHRARHPWRHTTMTRDQVRRAITHRARISGVPVDLALAVGWVESGWQQPLISPAGAVGVMQLLPSTGAWMSYYTDHRLNIYGTYDNIEGGVTLLRFLRAHTRHDKNAIGAYYQGLGALQRHGLFKETKHYVRTVQAVRDNLRRYDHPMR